jgi:hypothetical protein
MTTEEIRGLVRPIVTVMFSTAAIVYLFTGTAIPDRFWDLTLMVLAFWFGSRPSETAVPPPNTKTVMTTVTPPPAP